MTRLHLAYAVALLIPALAGTPAARARIAQSDAVQPDVEAFLRAAPLGDPVQLSSSLPAGFPSELLPVGGAVAVVSSSATVTTTVLTVPRPFNLIAYFDDLSRAGWTGDFGAAGGFVALPAEVMRSPNA